MKSKIGVFWNAVILIRWVLTDVLIIFLRDSPDLQIFLLLLLSFISLTLQLVGRPYTAPLDRYVNMFGEVMISAYLYVMMMLTEYHEMREAARGVVGQGLLYIVGASVLVNLLKFGYQVYLELKYAWIRRQARLKYLKEQEEVREYLEKLKKETEKIFDKQGNIDLEAKEEVSPLR